MQCCWPLQTFQGARPSLECPRDLQWFPSIACWHGLCALLAVWHGSPHCMQTLRLGLAYMAAQVAGGVVGAAAAFTSLPGSPCSALLSAQRAHEASLRANRSQLTSCCLFINHKSLCSSSAAPTGRLRPSCMNLLQGLAMPLWSDRAGLLATGWSDTIKACLTASQTLTCCASGKVRCTARACRLR